MIDLSPVFVPKAADVLAETLREQILNGRLGVGSLLPNERELSERAGLSRTSVREALRILEVEGLIATRTGRNGGSEVVRPTSATLERSIGIFIRGQNIRNQSVLEVREAIEPSIVEIINAVRDTIEETPPELVADIMDQGIVLAGGGALLLGMDVRFAAETKMPVRIADDPLTCVVRGTGIILEEVEALEKMLVPETYQRPLR